MPVFIFFFLRSVSILQVPTNPSLWPPLCNPFFPCALPRTSVTHVFFFFRGPSCPFLVFVVHHDPPLQLILIYSPKTTTFFRFPHLPLRTQTLMISPSPAPPSLTSFQRDTSAPGLPPSLFKFLFAPTDPLSHPSCLPKNTSLPSSSFLSFFHRVFMSVFPLLPFLRLTARRTSPPFYCRFFFEVPFFVRS